MNEEDLRRALSAGPPALDPAADAVANLVSGAAARRRRRQQLQIIGGTTSVVAVVVAITLTVFGLARNGSGSSTNPVASSLSSPSSSSTTSPSPSSRTGLPSSGTAVTTPGPTPPSVVPPSPSAPNAAATGGTSSSPRTSRSTDPDATTGHVPASRVIGFQSPSGNIRCVLSQQDRAVLCRLGNRTVVPAGRPAGCPEAAWGHVFRIDSTSGARAVCDVDDLFPDALATLDYGTGERLADIDCASREQGVTCTAFATGAGFRITSSAVDLFDGSTGPSSGSTASTATAIVDDPYFTGSAVAAGYQVRVTDTGTCSASQVSIRADARRCYSDHNDVLHNCYLRPDRQQAACLTEPSSKAVLLLTVQQDTPGTAGVSAAAWTITLSDGTVCAHTPNGYQRLTDGHDASYTCPGGRYVIGPVDRSSATWRATVETDGGPSTSVTVTSARL